MNLLSILGLAFIVIGTVLSFFGTINSDKKSQEELTTIIQEKNSVIDGINQTNNKINEQNSELLKGKDELLSQNNSLTKKIDSYQMQLADREAKIKELEKKVKNAKFGVKDKFHLDGSISPAGMSSFIGQGPVHELYLQLSELEKENTMYSWLKIKNICDEKIKTIPEWFTLYLFRGKALSAQGFKKEAIKDYEYVLENAEDDSEFAKLAKLLLNEINSK